MEWVVMGIIAALLVLSIAGIVYLERRPNSLRWNRKQRVAYERERAEWSAKNASYEGQMRSDLF